MIPSYDITETENVLKMVRMKNSSESVILVEGSADMRFYNKFISRNCCSIIKLNSNVAVIKFIKEHGNKKGIFGIIDADCHYINKNKNIHENIFITDHRDLETTLIESSSLDGILNEFADPHRWKEFEISQKKDIRNFLLQNTKNIGMLYCYNEKYRLYLKLNDVEFLRYFDKNYQLFDIRRYVDDIIKKSRNTKKLDANVIYREIIEDTKKISNLGVLCRGHDLTHLLFEILRKKIGRSFVDKDLKDTYHLEMILRAAYTKEQFMKTKLYSLIKNWENKNPLFKVFNDIDTNT